MTNELFARIVDALEKALGPVIASLVINIILREAKIKFDDAQLKVLFDNRVRALQARADEFRRAYPPVEPTE